MLFRRDSLEASNDWRFVPANKCAARSVPDWVKNGVIYQIQLRSFTDRGTINAATERLPILSALGVNIIYLSPITLADEGMDKAYWSPRQIRSGTTEPRNPYRVKDYFAIDPEYGSEEDFRRFVETAHSLGLKVLFDVVFYHCGPNAVFLKDHPDFIFRTTEDTIPSNITWHFPPLRFANIALKRYLWDNLLYWVTEFDVDGFRCDVADMVPLDFWETARKKLDGVKEGVMLLAEGSQPENHVYAFDAAYCFPYFYQVMKPFMDGEIDAAEFAARHDAIFAERPKGSLILHYFENHDIATDEVNNRVEVRLGHDACAALFALAFTLPGIPFIFNGQEIADSGFVEMFRLSPIDWSRSGDDVGAARTNLLRALIELRKTNSALSSGDLEWLKAETSLLVYRRGEGEQALVVMINYSKSPAEIEVPAEKMKVIFKSRAEYDAAEKIRLGAFGFAILGGMSE